MSGAGEILGRAFGYPYARHDKPLVFDPSVARHRLVALRGIGHDGAWRDGDLSRPVPRLAIETDAGVFRRYVAIVATGSNAAPEQLARKYLTRPDASPALVLPVGVHGAVSVYSAHVARYGSVPATLHPCAGATSALHVLCLASDELAHMNLTESLGINYRLAMPADIEVEADGHPVPDALAYVSKRGALRIGDGEATRLAGFHSVGCAFPQRGQREILDAVRVAVKDRRSLEAFVTALVNDDGLREAVTARLASRASPWTLGPDEIVAGA